MLGGFRSEPDPLESSACRALRQALSPLQDHALHLHLTAGLQPHEIHAGRHLVAEFVPAIPAYLSKTRRLQSVNQLAHHLAGEIVDDQAGRRGFRQGKRDVRVRIKRIGMIAHELQAGGRPLGSGRCQRLSRRAGCSVCPRQRAAAEFDDELRRICAFAAAACAHDRRGVQDAETHCAVAAHCRSDLPFPPDIAGQRALRSERAATAISVIPGQAGLGPRRAGPGVVVGSGIDRDVVIAAGGDIHPQLGALHAAGDARDFELEVADQRQAAVAEPQFRVAAVIVVRLFR